MRSLREIFANLREEYSKLTWFAIAILIVSFVPDWQGRIEYWSKVIRWTIPYLASPLGRVFLILCGIGIIWVDHRMVLRRRTHTQEDKTLQGRTRAFCNELRAFQKELGKEPAINYKSGDNAAEFTEKNKELTAWGQRMHHGFQLRFAERAARLFHEHGEQVRESYELSDALNSRIDSDRRLNAVIGAFSDLVKMSED